VLDLPILLVDDEPQVRLLMRTVLSKHGFRIVEEMNGLNALSTVQDLGGAISLLISDYSMPGLDGATLGSLVRSHYPAIPILLMSSDANSCDCSSGDAFLSKPFMPSMLIDTVRRLLLRTQDTQCA
jgi:CheY-like chemotaxis protein